MADIDTSAIVPGFYDRWADIYTQIARHAPGVGRLRRLTIDELDLDHGDIVVDMGCGPGVNLPYLRQAVGSDGQVIALDVAPAMLERTTRIDPYSDPVRGDARRPPLKAEVDAVLSTFVVTLFDDPDAVIDRWWSILAPGGSLAILNLAPMRGLAGTLGNPFLSIGLRAFTPGPRRYDPALLTVLERRVETATDAIDERATTLSRYDSADGLFRVTVGTKECAPHP